MKSKKSILYGALSIVFAISLSFITYVFIVSSCPSYLNGIVFISIMFALSVMGFVFGVKGFRLGKRSGNHKSIIASLIGIIINAISSLFILFGIIFTALS